jgi:hypothetical protein
MFKKAAPILQEEHCLHYKDEPENALYLGEKTLFFRESYKIHNPVVYSVNHTKSTIQLFIPGIIQNPQTVCSGKHSK